MKCRHFFSFVLVAFLSFFFGSFIITSDTFAVDDVVYNSSYGDSSFYICGGSSSVVCSDYSYIIFNPVPSSNGYSAISFSGVNIRFPSFSPSIFYIPSSVSVLNFQVGSYVSSITITLTNSLPSSSIPPSGNIDITSNGTYDVTEYAQATVNVPAEVIQGDYHDDLVNINQSIIVCGAILLVLYFFYCIYRLIIKNSGVH